MCPFRSTNLSGRRNIIKLCVLTLIIECSAISVCNTPSESWKSPCGVNGNPGGVTQNPDVPWVEEFVSRLEGTTQTLTKLQQELNNTSLRWRNCSRLEYDFLHLFGFPSRLNLEATQNNIIKDVMYDYTNLCSILVFMEQIIYDGDVLINSQMNMVCEAYYKLKDLLCQLRTIIDDKKIKELTPSDGVMDNEYRKIKDRLKKRLRNHLIFKDTIKYLEAMSGIYIEYIFH